MKRTITIVALCITLMALLIGCAAPVQAVTEETPTVTAAPVATPVVMPEPTATPEPTPEPTPTPTPKPTPPVGIGLDFEGQKKLAKKYDYIKIFSNGYIQTRLCKPFSAYKYCREVESMEEWVKVDENIPDSLYKHPYNIACENTEETPYIEDAFIPNMEMVKWGLDDKENNWPVLLDILQEAREYVEYSGGYEVENPEKWLKAAESSLPPTKTNIEDITATLAIKRDTGESDDVVFITDCSLIYRDNNERIRVRGICMIMSRTQAGASGKEIGTWYAYPMEIVLDSTKAVAERNRVKVWKNDPYAGIDMIHLERNARKATRAEIKLIDKYDVY